MSSSSTANDIKCPHCKRSFFYQPTIHSTPWHGERCEYCCDCCSRELKLPQIFPDLTYDPIECPECEDTGIRSTLIWHLNDHHNYSFVQIADWLDANV